mgnify:CR=1 FL=1
MPQNLSVQIVCPSPKVLDFDEKRLHWASIVRACMHAVDLIAENSIKLSFKIIFVVEFNIIFVTKNDLILKCYHYFSQQQQLQEQLKVS